MDNTMEKKEFEKGTYIAIHGDLVRDRLFESNRRKTVWFFMFLFQKASENIPEKCPVKKNVVVHTNKDEWRSLIEGLNIYKPSAVITMTDIKLFLRKIEKEGLAILKWNNGDLKITFSQCLMYYGED